MHVAPITRQPSHVTRNTALPGDSAVCEAIHGGTRWRRQSWFQTAAAAAAVLRIGHRVGEGGGFICGRHVTHRTSHLMHYTSLVTLPAVRNGVMSSAFYLRERTFPMAWAAAATAASPGKDDVFACVCACVQETDSFVLIVMQCESGAWLQVSDIRFPIISEVVHSISRQASHIHTSRITRAAGQELKTSSLHVVARHRQRLRNFNSLPRP